MAALEGRLREPADAIARHEESVFVEISPWRDSGGEDLAQGTVPETHLANVGIDFADASDGGDMRLPSIARAGELVSRWRGIDDEREIVLFTRRAHDLPSATRAWFVLASAGVTGLSILHGGLPAWRDAGGPLGRPVERAHRPGPPFSAGLPIEGPHLIDADQLLEAARRGTVLDARSAAGFQGVEHQPRSGHVPGAVHAPASELLTERGRLLPPGDLRRWLLSRRAMGAHELAAYCGGGVLSTALVFAMSLLDQPVRWYRGSWQEWVRRGDLPVEHGRGGASALTADSDCFSPAYPSVATANAS